jgi:hypothetical protein
MVGSSLGFGSRCLWANIPPLTFKWAVIAALRNIPRLANKRETCQLPGILQGITRNLGGVPQHLGCGAIHQVTM